jgi:hypothetical protein
MAQPEEGAVSMPSRLIAVVRVDDMNRTKKFESSHTPKH